MEIRFYASQGMRCTMYDIIGFENLPFRPSTRKRKPGIFKNLHFGERFEKDAFSVTVSPDT